MSAHRPVIASVGNSFVVAEVTPDALTRAAPDIGRFREAVAAFPDLGPRRLPLYLYAHTGPQDDRFGLRARMFSPLSGTIEDAATGSAATPLAALLLSLTKDTERRYDIVQGVEMGRPSLLRTSAHRAADGIRASVGGGCVPDDARPERAHRVEVVLHAAAYKHVCAVRGSAAGARSRVKGRLGHAVGPRPRIFCGQLTVGPLPAGGGDDVVQGGG